MKRAQRLYVVVSGFGLVFSAAAAKLAYRDIPTQCQTNLMPDKAKAPIPIDGWHACSLEELHHVDDLAYLLDTDQLVKSRELGKDRDGAIAHFAIGMLVTLLAMVAIRAVRWIGEGKA